MLLHTVEAIEEVHKKDVVCWGLSWRLFLITTFKSNIDSCNQCKALLENYTAHPVMISTVRKLAIVAHE